MNEMNMNERNEMNEMNMNRLRSFGVATSLLAFCLLASFSPATAEAGSTIHNVRVNGDIQAAIDVASNGDTIQLAAGQYDITTTIDPGGKDVTILGTVDGNGDPTSILDGGNPVRKSRGHPPTWGGKVGDTHRPEFPPPERDCHESNGILADGASTKAGLSCQLRGSASSMTMPSGRTT